MVRLEMNFYAAAKQWVVLVLVDDPTSEHDAICHYPKNKREATKVLATLEKQYNVTGTVNE